MPNQILILENSQQDRLLLTKLFEQEGAVYQLVFVDRLADAHRNLQKQSYDLLLCSSDFATIALTELQSQCSCPCILLGKKDEESKIADLMPKFNNYVIKDNSGAYFQILLALIKGIFISKTQADKNVSAKLSLESEEFREKYLLLQAIQLSSFPIILVDANAPDLPITYTNPAFENMTGYPLYEVLGKNCRFLQRGDTEQEGLAKIRAAIRAGEKCNVTIRNYRKDGSLFWNNLNISPIYDRAGELTHFLGVQHDVTEQKQLEAERHAIDARYRNIIEDQVDLVFRYDKNLQITFANQAYCQHLGLSADKIIGQSILAQIPTEKHEEARQHVYSLSQEKPLATSIHQSILADGTVRNFEWKDRAIFNAQGEIVEYQGIGRDVSTQEAYLRELETAKQKLEEEQTYINNILATMQDALMSVRLSDRKHIYSSASHERVFGYPIERFMDDPYFFKKVIPADALPAVIASQEKCLRDGFVEVEHPIIFPDGSTHWLHRRAWISYDANGKPLLVNDSASDITERKLAQDALAASEEQYRTILENISDAVFVTNDAGALQFICPNAQIIFGYSSAEIAEMPNISQLIGKNTFNFAELEFNGVLSNIQAEITDKFGSKHLLLVTVKRVNLKLGSLLYVCRDITERAQAESTIHFQADLLQQVSDAIISTDLNLRISSWNEAASEIYGWTAEEALGQILDELLQTEWENDKQADAQTMLLQKGHWTGALKQVTKNKGNVYVMASVNFLRNPYGEIVGGITINRDISVLREQEAELRFHSEVLQRMSEGVHIVGQDGTFLYSNPRFDEMFAYKAGELIGQSPSVLNDPDVRNPQETVQVITQSLLERGEWSGEVQNIRKDGSRFWTRASISGFEHQAYGHVWVTVQQDISAEKAAHAAREKSEAIFQAFIQSLPGVMFILDPQNHLQFANPRYARSFGQELVAIIGKNMRDYGGEELAAIAQQENELVLRTNASIDINYTDYAAEKPVHWRITKFPIPQAAGEVLIGAIALDVSKEQEAESALRQSELRLRLFIEHAPAAIAMLDKEMRYLAVSHRWLQDYRKEEEAILGKSHYEVFPEIPERWKLIHQRCLAGAVESADADPFPRLDGQIDWVRWEVRPWYDNNSEIGGLILFSELINERIEAENAVKESNDWMRIALDASGLGKWQHDIESNSFRFDEQARQHYGFTQEIIAADEVMQHIHPADLPQLVEGIANTLAGINEGRFNIEYRVIHPDGSIHWLAIHARVNFNDADGQKTARYGFGTSQDISARKQSEVALQASEKRYRQMFELHGLPKLIIDAETGQLFDANPAAALYYGYPVAELRKLSIFDLSLSAPDDVRKKMTQAAVSSMLSCQFVHKGADQKAHDVEIFTGPVEIDGKDYLYSIITDISEKERAKTALEQLNQSLEDRILERTAALADAKQRIEAIFHSSADALIYYDSKAGIQQVNRRFEQLVGATEVDWLGKDLSALLAVQDREKLAECLKKLYETQAIQEIQVTVVRADGSTFDAEISFALLKDGASSHEISRGDWVGGISYETKPQKLRAASDAYSLVCSIRDVSERKRLQRSIGEERNLLRTVIDAVPDYIYVKDLEHRMVLNNLSHAKSLGFKHPREAIGKTDRDLFPKEMAKKFWADEEKLFQNAEGIIDTEELSMGANGEVIWALTTKIPLRNLQGELIGLVGITHDVSLIKRQEEALRQSETRLRESEKMLQLVLDTIPVRVFWKDRHSVYLGCNQLFANDAGLETTAEIIGKHDADLAWGNFEASAYQSDDADVAATGIPKLAYEEMVSTFNGQKLTVQTSKLPLLNEANEIIGVLGTYLDITEKKRAEQALLAKYEEERELQNYHKALHQITLVLTKVESLDDFYRVTVGEALLHLGFERVGLLLYEAKTNSVMGTYGTDAQGKLQAEHDIKLLPSDLTGILNRTLERSERFAFDENAALFARGQLLGYGQNAVAALWNGEVLGWIAVDNAVAHQAITKAQLEILSLYALAVGALLARKRAEFALRDSEARYRFLTDNVNDMIVKMDASAQISFVTPSSQKFLGYTQAEMLGRNGFELVHPDDLAEVQEIMLKSIQAGATSFHLEERLRHRDGHYLWVDVANNTIYDELQSNPIEMVGVIRDITERKNAENALRESEEKFRLFIESAPIATVITEKNGKIALVNKACETLLGYSREELLNEYIEILVPQHLHEKHVQLRDGSDHDKLRTTARELVARHRDGSSFPVEIQLSLIEMTPEPMVMSFIIDIRQRKAAENALKQSLAKEKELGELKTRFVSMASHEFRTPLASILATAETIGIYRAKMSEAQIEQRINKIRQQVQHMKQLIDDMLQLARFQAGRVEFNPSIGDLDALCQEIIEEYEIQADYSGRITYQVELENTLCNFDNRLMRQVISNVISNALKYSQKTVSIALRMQDAEICLLVKDDGIGIPEADLKHLFEPFHRAKNVGTISGTGLGLGISKQAIESHGGRIELKTELGQGTEISIFLPVGKQKD